MALRALGVYKREVAAGSPEIRPELHRTELFSALELTEVPDVEGSKALNSRRGPMIIVSASGMATGGRVIHHLAHRVGDHRNAVLLVGFQAPGTRGDALRSGARQLKMLGRHFPVRADVTSVALVVACRPERPARLGTVGFAGSPDDLRQSRGTGRIGRVRRCVGSDRPERRRASSGRTCAARPVIPLPRAWPPMALRIREHHEHDTVCPARLSATSDV